MYGNFNKESSIAGINVRSNYCDICNLGCNSLEQFQVHLTGFKHLKKKLTSRNNQLGIQNIDVSKNDSLKGCVNMFPESSSCVLNFDDDKCINTEAKENDLSCSADELLGKEAAEFQNTNVKKQSISLADRNEQINIASSTDDSRQNSLMSTFEQQTSMMKQKNFTSNQIFQNEQKAANCCYICDKTFSGRVCFEQHVASEKHKKKKVAYETFNHAHKTVCASDGAMNTACEGYEMSVVDKNLNCNFSKLECSKNDCMDKKKRDMIKYCNVCDMSFTSQIPYEQHMTGKTHKKKASQKLFLIDIVQENKIDYESFNLIQLKESLTEPVESTNMPCYKRSKLEIIENSNNVSKQFAANGKEVSTVSAEHIPLSVGEEFTENSLHNRRQLAVEKSADVSAMFYKKIPEIEIVSKQRKLSSSELIAKLNRLPYEKNEPKSEIAKVLATPFVMQYSCQPCDKTFSGIIPYEAHLASKRHQRICANYSIDDIDKLDSNSSRSSPAEINTLNELVDFNPKLDYTFISPEEEISFSFEK